MKLLFFTCRLFSTRCTNTSRGFMSWRQMTSWNCLTAPSGPPCSPRRSSSQWQLIRTRRWEDLLPSGGPPSFRGTSFLLQLLQTVGVPPVHEGLVEAQRGPTICSVSKQRRSDPLGLRLDQIYLTFVSSHQLSDHTAEDRQQPFREGIPRHGKRKKRKEASCSFVIQTLMFQLQFYLNVELL